MTPSQHGVLNRYEISMSTRNKAHLHRSINVEAKANEHNTSDMTYKGIQNREHTCHISHKYHYHINITITLMSHVRSSCMKVNMNA